MRSFAQAGLHFSRVVSIGRFFVGLVLGVLIVAAAWFALFEASLGIPLTFNDRSLKSWYRTKTEVVGRLKGKKRIFLVGGSNVNYGIDARAIEQATGIPTVNFGTHAALNLDFLLWRVSKLLKSGDLVILSLEWDHFSRGPYDFNDVSASYLVGSEPDYLNKLPRRNFVGLMMTSGWDRLLVPFALPRKDSIRIQDLWDKHVAADSFDDRGDMKHNTPAEKVPSVLRALDAVILKPGLVLDARADPGDPVWIRIGNFIKLCRKRNVAVLVTFPSLMESPAYRSPDAGKKYRQFERNYRAIGAKVLTSQEQTLYPKDHFFDSIYHLQSDARKERTALILAALAREGVLPPPAKP